MLKSNRKVVWGIVFGIVFALAAIPALAQMKTPSPMDSKDSKTDEQEDDYYEQEQAGGIDYSEEDTATVLDKETIKGVINKRNQSILYCYEKELQTNQKLKGRVVINLTINLDGSVSDVNLVKKASKLTDKKVTDCVVDIMKSLKFPSRKKGDPITINYPFNFQHAAK